jgi:hypothetical protein
MKPGAKFLQEAKRKRLDLEPDEAYHDFLYKEGLKNHEYRNMISRIGRRMFLFTHMQYIGVQGYEETDFLEKSLGGSRYTVSRTTSRQVGKGFASLSKKYR